MIVFELRYSQNGSDAVDGPSIATLWDRPSLDAVPSDCAVVEIEMDEDTAFRGCE